MTPEEAKIFLPHDDISELEDVYEEKLFEAKQFFLSRFPISKVIQGRIKKLALIQQAWEVLSDKCREEATISLDTSFSDTHDLATIWNEYQQKRNALKLNIQQSNDVVSAGKWGELLVKVVCSFCVKLELHSSPEGEKIPIGKEPDPMDIHFDIQRWKEKGVESIQQISRITEDSPMGIELKRLSLWFKNESNG